MFISVLELFKIGIGPSSSHTLGPLVAAQQFLQLVHTYLQDKPQSDELQLRCILKGSLALTGKGHGSDRAIILGLHGYSARQLADTDVDRLLDRLEQDTSISLDSNHSLHFQAQSDIVFDTGDTLPEHPNGMVFQLLDKADRLLLEQTYFSIGGGFISTREDIQQVVAPLKLAVSGAHPYPFDSGKSMLQMADDSGLNIAAMKRHNELHYHDEEVLRCCLDEIWQSMQLCLERGLACEGILPGGLQLPRRAAQLHQQLLQEPDAGNVNDWLCAYAMAVAEENAAGHMVVTAPTNGSAGVVAAVLYYLVRHQSGSREQIHNFLLTAATIGSIIKQQSSISGAEVGCQGEVGSAASMAAAGLCAAWGGTSEQIENAAAIALEHHLGMTCDPVKGLVQIPCIERNGFGAVKAYVAASLAMRYHGRRFVPLDSCIAAMKQTGLEMSSKFKETALGGLAVSVTEC